MNLIDLSAVSPATVKVGDEGTVWWGGCGQSGTVTAVGTDGSIEITGPAGNPVTVAKPDRFVPAAAEAEADRFQDLGWNDWEASKDRRHEFPSEAAELAYSIGWSNAVRYGDRNRDSISRYADSDVEPEWLDPGFAGERWDDD